MNESDRLRVWHVGNWCIQIGQKYIESPFEAPSKDVEVINYAQPFVDALRSIPGADVISQPSWELYHMSPDGFDERLKWATTIVFGDVETKCLMLHPDFFQRAKWGEQSLVFPDRFDLLRGWVEGGGHFHMNGGWLSFGGELGKGGWGRSRFHTALPVECLQGDDLIESTAGFQVRTTADAKGLDGLDFASAPALLGFNETTLREGSAALVEIEGHDRWHPLLALRQLGRGRVTCWTSGASPHWGINFVRWPDYPRFWTQLFSLGRQE